MWRLSSGIKISKSAPVDLQEIFLPSSKSISNRLLILQYLAGNSFSISGLSAADDTVLLASLIKKISFYLKENNNEELLLDTENAGTVMRFLLPLTAMIPGNYIVTGNDRMKNRPVEGLVSALHQLGARVGYVDRDGYPPVRVTGKPLKGGEVSVSTDVTSQYLSALILVAPFFQEGLKINIGGNRRSWAYVKMTLETLRNQGVMIEEDDDSIRILPKRTGWLPAFVETDWSSVAYWYLLATIVPMRFFFPGLTSQSIQGDSFLKELGSAFGISTIDTGGGIRIVPGGEVSPPASIDMSSYPDLVIPVVLMFCSMKWNIEISGIDHLEFKESDRLSALSEELGKIGCIFTRKDRDTWNLNASHVAIEGDLEFKTFSDHRMAMSFAMLAAGCDSVTLNEHRSISKSFPGFWDEMRKSGFSVQYL